MRTLMCRIGMWSHPEYRRKRVVARRGRLALVREPRTGGYTVMHVPTRLAVHPALQNMALPHARVAMALAPRLCSWDWDDPGFILNLPWQDKGPLYEVLGLIAEMASS